MTNLFRYASHFTDHMVLQHSTSPVIWGYVPDCDQVNIQFKDVTISGLLYPLPNTCKCTCTYI